MIEVSIFLVGLCLLTTAVWGSDSDRGRQVVTIVTKKKKPK